MNDTIKAIFDNINTSCSKDCDYAHTTYSKECRKCLVDLVYTAHVKPLEDALAKAEADKAIMPAALEQAWYVLDSAAAGVAPRVAAAMAREHVEKFIGARESNFDDSFNARKDEADALARANRGWQCLNL